jgi:hypothetical protein
VASRLKLASVLDLVVPAALTAALVRRIDDFDIWYHLVIGREVVQSLRIPRAEFFVYPLLGQPTSFHEWGFGALFYVAHVAFGFWGMSALNAALGGVAFWLLYRTASRRASLPAVAILALAALFPLLAFRIVYRPETLLFAALAAEIACLESYTENRRLAALTPIPFLALALSNAHPSALFLLLVYGFYGLQWLWGARGEGRAAWPRLGREAGIGLAMLVASLLNPYGWRQLVLPIEFARTIDVLGNMEFVGTLDTGYRWAYAAMVVVGLGALIANKRRRILDSLLVSAFGYLALRHVRNVALFALVLYVPVVRALEEVLARSRRADRLRSTTVTSMAAAFAVLSAGTAAALTGSWGAGPLPDRFPAAAATTIAEIRPRGSLFNYYDFGGYLAWRLLDLGYPVSIDGRHYGKDAALALHDEVFFEADSWPRRAKEIGIAAVVMPATARFSGQLIALLPLLDADDSWILVSSEPGALLFVRRDSVPTDRLPGAINKDAVWIEARAEARAVATRFPRHAQAWLTLGIADFKLRRWSDAANGFARYLALAPGDRESAEILALLRAAVSGDTKALARIEAMNAAGRGADATAASQRRG